MELKIIYHLHPENGGSEHNITSTRLIKATQIVYLDVCGQTVAGFCR